MSGHLSSVWGRTLHFKKFTRNDFQKATAYTVFILFQPNVMESMAISDCHTFHKV